jgi:bifunctional UDP-N-acetylglucosamine pyrophosphorylase/glucosamine-1-phosphate N-acetyltransferase
VLGIVEEKDCTPDQRQIREINTGVMCFKTQTLLDVIDLIRNDNAKGEYYLTDTIGLINQKGGVVKAHVCADSCEGTGHQRHGGPRFRLVDDAQKD